VTTARRGQTPRRRIAETVAAELRSRILVGEAGAEDQLPTQDQLVREFGVSYPSIREALRILETEGLVTVRRGSVGGAEVHRPDESSAAYHLGLALQGARVTLGDLAVGQQMLEPMCAAECAMREDRAEAVVPALLANLDAGERTVGDTAAFMDNAREFHELLLACTPNATVRYVVRTLAVLWAAQQEAWSDVLTQRGDYPTPEESAAALATHRRIAETIAAGDAAAAQRLARAHLASTQALVLDRFDDGVVSALPGIVRSEAGPGPDRSRV
jgi:DNA-binding FadR family transcriptional regulator